MKQITREVHAKIIEYIVLYCASSWSTDRSQYDFYKEALRQYMRIYALEGESVAAFAARIEGMEFNDE